METFIVVSEGCKRLLLLLLIVIVIPSANSLKNTLEPTGKRIGYGPSSYPSPFSLHNTSSFKRFASFASNTSTAFAIHAVCNKHCLSYSKNAKQT